jgi:hypothetical protein
MDSDHQTPPIDLTREDTIEIITRLEQDLERDGQLSAGTLVACLVILWKGHDQPVNPPQESRC